MSKRKKRIIIILIILIAIYFLLIGASYFYLKNFIYPTFEDFACKPVQEYPYSNAEIPDSFAEYSMNGLKLNAPDCLESHPEYEMGSVYLSNDMEKCNLQIISSKHENVNEDLEWIKGSPNLFNKWITGCGWLTKLGIKKMGYEVPQSNNDLMYLLQKMDMDDYNKFSLIETYAYTKLMILDAVMIPSDIRLNYDETHAPEHPLEVEERMYSLEKDSFRAIIRQSGSEDGRYSLLIRYFPQSDAENIKEMLILSDDPELVQSIAASVRPA